MDGVCRVGIYLVNLAAWYISYNMGWMEGRWRIDGRIDIEDETTNRSDCDDLMMNEWGL